MSDTMTTPHDYAAACERAMTANASDDCPCTDCNDARLLSALAKALRESEAIRKTPDPDNVGVEIFTFPIMTTLLDHAYVIALPPEVTP
ncbi:MAG: hypothetical protein ACYC3L_01150 [Gemmatimonadaceae bacterium]